MVPLFSRLPQAGPRRGPFSGRLLCVASIFLFVLSVALAFSATASAHTAQASTGAHALSKQTTQRCLFVQFYEDTYPPGMGNTALFYFSMYNRCGFPVHNIVVTYDETQLGCDQAGTGNRQGSFSVPNLAVGGQEHTTLSFTSYCISCSNGVISGFPPFSLQGEIKDAVGIIQERGTPLAILGPSRLVDTADILNEAHNPGPLNCLGR